MMQLDEIIDLVCRYACCLFYFWGFSTNNWIVDSFTSTKMHSGLFEKCEDNDCMESKQESLPIIFICMGFSSSLVCTAAATVFRLKREILKKNVNQLPAVIFLFSITGGLFSLTGCAVYSYRTFGQGAYPGYSFIVIALCGVGLLFSGSLK